MFVAALFACSLLLSSYASPARIPLAPRLVVIARNRSGRDTENPREVLSDRLHLHQRNAVKHFNIAPMHTIYCM